MQVIKGSHRLGRINHVLSGDQAGADMERVEEAKKARTRSCNNGTGDTFFHSNTLHASMPIVLKIRMGYDLLL